MGATTVASLTQTGLYIYMSAQLNIDADNLHVTNAILNNGTLNLGNGTLTASVTGNGTTLINGNVTTTAASIQQDITVNTGKSLTANADLLGVSKKITIDNCGTLILTGSNDDTAPL